MAKTKRLIWGLLCAAVVLLSVVATAGEALAAVSSAEADAALVSRGPKDKHGGKDKPRDNGGSVQPTGVTWESARVTWEALGVTWE